MTSVYKIHIFFLKISGFILALLSILIAVGVGLIVHFAENRSLECTSPDTLVLGDGQSQGQSGNGQQGIQITMCQCDITDSFHVYRVLYDPNNTYFVLIFKHYFLKLDNCKRSRLHFHRIFYVNRIFMIILTAKPRLARALVTTLHWLTIFTQKTCQVCLSPF